MIKKLSFILSLAVCMTATAKPVVDCYGLDPKQSEKILHQYAGAVSKLEERLYQTFEKPNHQTEELEKIVQEKNRLVKQIEKEGSFLYVNFNTVMYPDKPDRYTTIEIIPRNKPGRLKWSEPARSAAKYQPKNDLIQKMLHFEEIEMSLMLQHQLNFKTCPVQFIIVLAVFNTRN